MQWGWISITPVHHDQESIPVVPTGPSAGADLHSPYPGPRTPSLAWSPCEDPEALSTGFEGGKGQHSLLEQASQQRSPLHFGILLGTSNCFRTKAESFS